MCLADNSLRSYIPTAHGKPAFAKPNVSLHSRPTISQEKDFSGNGKAQSRLHSIAVIITVFFTVILILNKIKKRNNQ